MRRKYHTFRNWSQIKDILKPKHFKGDPIKDRFHLKYRTKRKVLKIDASKLRRDILKAANQRGYTTYMKMDFFDSFPEKAYLLMRKMEVLTTYSQFLSRLRYLLLETNPLADIRSLSAIWVKKNLYRYQESHVPIPQPKEWKTFSPINYPHQVV